MSGSGQRARVLVVDDSVRFRAILAAVIAGAPDMVVAGSAEDGVEALEKAATLRPDIVILDVEMPRMDGLEALKELRRTHPDIAVFMCSALTTPGSAASLEALAAGAAGYVTKPSAADQGEVATEDLAELVLVPLRALMTGLAADTSADESPVDLAPLPSVRQPIEAVVIGSSIGGPVALDLVLSTISPPLPVPIVIAQHIPPAFTAALADRLDRRSGFPVVEAEAGQSLEPGCCYLAPGGRHLTVDRIDARTVVTRLDDGPRIKNCRPAVERLFASAGEAFGGGLLAVVLTGMGKDGVDACHGLADVGVEIIVQDEATSVVWGMAGAVARAGLANQCLPIGQIAGAIEVAVEQSLSQPDAVFR